MGGLHQPTTKHNLQQYRTVPYRYTVMTTVLCFLQFDCVSCNMTVFLAILFQFGFATSSLLICKDFIPFYSNPVSVLVISDFSCPN